MFKKGPQIQNKVPDRNNNNMPNYNMQFEAKSLNVGYNYFNSDVFRENIFRDALPFYNNKFFKRRSSLPKILEIFSELCGEFKEITINKKTVQDMVNDLQISNIDEIVNNLTIDQVIDIQRINVVHNFESNTDAFLEYLTAVNDRKKDLIRQLLNIENKMDLLKNIFSKDKNIDGVNIINFWCTSIHEMIDNLFPRV